MPEYIIQMNDGEYHISPSNARIMRFTPNLIDHLEITTGGMVVAAYNCFELLQELEDEGYPHTPPVIPEEAEIALAALHLQSEIEALE